MFSFRHSYALVIGIDSYSNGIPHLKTAVSDATEITKVLETEHGYTVIQLLDEKATREQIQHVLEVDLLAKIQPGDRFLFYFAGHGIALNGDDGPEGYLIPQDASFGNVSTYLPMSQVHQALLQLPCRHLLGVLDCCFAGAFRWSSTRKLIPAELGTIHKERFDRFIQDPAWQVITSASFDQTASDGFDLKDDRGQKGEHSPFAAALIEALQGKADVYPPAEPGKPAGDGVITATELYLYLRERLEVETEARLLRQTPGIYPLKKHDKGEYIFLAPGHPLNLPPAPPLDVSSNPYRGLESFNEADKDLFFGRQALTQQLSQFVQDHALTIVLGASGSGKSSLVKAGLIPHLRKVERWYILLPFRPGESPLKALNQVLESLNSPAIAPHERVASTTQLTPLQSVSQWFEKHLQVCLLLVVDQLEELITLCKNDQERHQFLKLLAQAIALHPNQLHLVLTLRSDFEPQFRNTPLEDNWLNARFIVPPMTREELRQAIEEPASARVMYFAPHELVDQLIDEVANMPGALPLLSFALSELYLNYLKRQEAAKLRGETLDRAMTQADYEKLGGVTRSLTQRADQEYEALVNQDPAYAQTIRHVMLRMVAVEGELARRRVPLSELEYPKSENIRVQAVIKHFEDTRLLTTDKDPEGQPYVEPVHDVLVRGWKRFLDWKQREQENLILQRRLTPAAVDWSSHQQAKFLWNANPRLDLLKKTLKSQDNWFNQVEAEFVRHSLTKRLRNTIIRWSIASGILVAAIGAALFFNRLRLIEEENRVNAEISLNSATAERVFSSNELEGLIAILKVVQSLEREGKKISPETRMRVVRTLQKIIYGIKQSNQLEGSGSSPAFSPDGQTIAIPNNGKVQLLRSSGEKTLEFGQLGDGWGKVIAFSPDSQKIAILATGNTIELYNLQGKKLKALRLKDIALGGMCELAFKSDGHTVTTACYGNNTVTFWDLKTNKHLSLKFEGYGIAAVSPDGQIVATCVGNTVKLWNLQGKELRTLNGHSSGIWSIVFSPDGQTIATASLDHTAKLWNLKGKELLTLKGHRYWVKSVAFSPDGRTIATGSQDRTVKLWNLEGKELKHLIGHDSWVDNVAFSPNGQILTTISSDNGTIMFWNLKGEKLQGFHAGVNSIVFAKNQTLFSAGGDGAKMLNLQGKPLKKLSSGVSNVAISPDGHTIATFEGVWGREAVKLWNLEGEVIETLSMNWGCNLALNDVAFSSDGQTLATVCMEGTVKVWNLKTKAERNTLPGQRGGFSLGTPTKKLVFSPDGQMIASTTVDSSVKLWNWQKNTLKTISGHSQVVKSVAFSPDGHLLATASQDRTIKLWNLKGEELQTITGHGQAVNSVTFSPDSQILFSSSDDGTVKIWNLQGEELQTLTQYGQAIKSINLSPDGQTLISASADGEVILWNLNLKDLSLRGCNWLQAYLVTHPKTLSELRMCVTEPNLETIDNQ